MKYKAYSTTASSHINQAIFDDRDRVVTDLITDLIGNDIQK